MLQIASGMYFRPGVPLNERLYRTTFYTNAFRIDHEPVELPVATLRFSTAFAAFQPVTVEAWGRLEAERPDGRAELLVATNGEELVADVAALLAFASNTTWSTDSELVRRLVPDALSDRPRRWPSNQLRSTFDPQVLLTDEAVADTSVFATQLLALHRPEYEKAMRAIRRVVDATVLVGSDVSLAYTLFVAALESLASDWLATPTNWDQYDPRKRVTIDRALADVDVELAERVRQAVLDADALGLGRKFRGFVVGHLEPSFYRGEAVGALRPISAHALPNALTFAYQVRSRQVHALERLEPEMWEVAHRSDTVTVDGRTVLSLEGLNRLCRHVIRRYVERAPTNLDTTFDYRSALPGILKMQLAPELWIGHPDGVQVGRGPALLNGFLEMCLPVLRGEQDELPVDMRDALERVETLLPGEASAVKRAPLVALYGLWHGLVPEEFHRPNPNNVLTRFGSDLDKPSSASLAARVVLSGDVPWSTEDLVVFAEQHWGQLLRGKAAPLPSTFDAALQLCLARRLAQEGQSGEAGAALKRAVETVPGDEDLMQLEERVLAGDGRSSELADYDVRTWLLGSTDLSGESQPTEGSDDDDSTPTRADLDSTVISS